MRQAGMSMPAGTDATDGITLGLGSSLGGFRMCALFVRLRENKGWGHLAVLVAAIAATSLVGLAQGNQLRLVSTAWPPFTNVPGQPRFALDLVEAALGRFKVTTTTVIVDAEKYTSSLLSGQFDGSAAAWKDAERERIMLFSQPYLENRLILVG